MDTLERYDLIDAIKTYIADWVEDVKSDPEQIKTIIYRAENPMNETSLFMTKKFLDNVVDLVDGYLE